MPWLAYVSAIPTILRALAQVAIIIEQMCSAANVGTPKATLAKDLLIAAASQTEEGLEQYKKMEPMILTMLNSVVKFLNAVGWDAAARWVDQMDGKVDLPPLLPPATQGK